MTGAVPRQRGPAIIRLGAVADDLTGACDLASWTSAAGLSTIVLLGIPEPPQPTEAECTIVALKSRTDAPANAAAATAAAAGWLTERGAGVIYHKYCSTFDSTDAGNIGPAADALSEVLAFGRAPALNVGTPATPVNGRTQYQGHLFVGDRLLAESSMRDHPLTPMRDSDLVRVLGRQTARPVALVPHGFVRAGADAVRSQLHKLASNGAGHILVDAVSDEDLDTVADAVLAEIAGKQDIVAGGAAGLGAAIAGRLSLSRPHSPSESRERPGTARRPVRSGRRLIISGSASERTREQISAFSGTVITLDVLELTRTRDADAFVDALLDKVATAFVAQGPEQPVLIRAASPAAVRAAHDAIDRDAAAARIENALAAIAERAARRLDVTHLIVAGGETSGAVAAALGIRALRVARSAAPGVPWMVGSRPGADACALLLKSGNFGGRELFTTAWGEAP